MRRFPSLILWLAVAGLCLGQSASMMVNRDVRRVGLRLACLCGSCKNTVGDCQMIGCSYSSPARAKIARMLSQGMTDQRILDQFVAEQGVRALAVPPAQGFHVTVWLAPIGMVLLGLYAIYVYVRRQRAPAPAPASVSEHHEELARRELAKMD